MVHGASYDAYRGCAPAAPRASTRARAALRAAGRASEDEDPVTASTERMPFDAFGPAVDAAAEVAGIRGAARRGVARARGDGEALNAVLNSDVKGGRGGQAAITIAADDPRRRGESSDGIQTRRRSPWRSSGGPNDGAGRRRRSRRMLIG